MSYKNTAISYPNAAAHSVRYSGFFMGKAHKFSRFFLLSVFYLSLLFCPTALHAAQAELTFSFPPQEQSKEHFKQETKSLNQTQTAYFVQSIVYMQALQQVHASLASQRTLAFGIQDPLAQMALVAELYTPHFTQKNTPHGITVAVELKAQKSATSAHIRELLAHKSLLNLRLEWLQQIRKYAQEGSHFLLMTSGFGNATKAAKQNSYTSDINPLYKEAAPSFHKKLTNQALLTAQHLEALWLCDTALRHFQEVWQQPSHVAQLMQKALNLYKNSALLWACLGEVQLQMDSPQEAIHSLNEALRLEPTRARALYIRGLAHLRLQQPSLAKVDFSAALAEQTQNPSWLRARGAAHMLLEEYDLMCADFSQACAQGDCEGLQNARQRDLCLPHASEENTDTTLQKK